MAKNTIPPEAFMLATGKKPDAPIGGFKDITEEMMSQEEPEDNSTDFIEVPTPEDDKVLDIPLTHIIPGMNSRKNFKDEQTFELMTSFRKQGQLQPVGVKHSKTDPGKYDLVFGYRRFHAASKLQWKSIRAIIVLPEQQGHPLIVQAVENMQRHNPPLAEQGSIFFLLQKHEKMTPSEIAAAVGVSVKRVKDCMNMFIRLPAWAKDRVVDGKPGNRNKEGKIPVATANKVREITNAYPVKEADERLLFEFAAGDGVTKDHLHVVKQFMDNGIPVSKAIEQSRLVRMLTVTLAVRQKDIDQLEEASGRNYRDILLDTLYARKELNIMPMRVRTMNRKNKNYNAGMAEFEPAETPPEKTE